DRQEAEALLNSLKDRAENLMIVDLLRNDIGKVCEIGSVKVDALFRLQRFTNVHHLVSIVRGVLADGYHALDLLRGCFPGGSITGAPKLRAMQIIEELEPHRRGIYCGSIGYIGFDGSMDTNIAIRTAVICRQNMTFFAGGGVVADSDCDKEYQETLDKASQFLKLVAQFKTAS
ncbi:anthranilate synthase component I family protein, partial [Methylophilus sp.]